MIRLKIQYHFKMRYDISTESGLTRFLTEVGKMRIERKRVTVELVEDTCTPAQFNAAHAWFEMCAATLNAAGLDMKRGTKATYSLPWTKQSFKDYIWKPLQLVMTGKESSKDGGKMEYPEVSETITRHFAQEYGVQLPPWPSRESV